MATLQRGDFYLNTLSLTYSSTSDSSLLLISEAEREWARLFGIWNKNRLFF
jgi:hypothetical protein